MVSVGYQNWTVKHDEKGNLVLASLGRVPKQMNMQIVDDFSFREPILRSDIVNRLDRRKVGSLKEKWPQDACSAV